MNLQSSIFNLQFSADISAVVVAITLSFAATAGAQTPPAAPQATPVAAPAPPNNYGDAASWLCRPGRADACAVEMNTTIVAADGKLTKETWQADANAPIDCFYVYPTVSTDTTINSDMTADPAERNVVRQQFARLASRCRPYAPLYRQITLTGLRRILVNPATTTTAFATGVHYDDVRDAWRHYLANDNRGRGFVLVGHSQGAFILIDLIRNEIDGKPIQSRMVSAILMGTTVPVTRGKNVGGAFQNIPLCTSASQTGCLITFATFRSTLPPPANTLFGKVVDPAMSAACTNPAALGGGSGQLKAYLTKDGNTITSTIPPKPWVMPEQPIDTPWVSVPGLLTAECKTNEHATYLEVTVHGSPSDPRVDDITGDLGAGPQILANWGLHLIDVNLAMGNLIDIVGQQAKAYTAKAR
jgi:hypothetical protein